MSSRDQAERHTGARSVQRALRWVGFSGILTIAIMRCLILFAPQVVFDVDPAMYATPLLGLGPAGSLLLDALLVICCTAALAGEWMGGRSLRLMMLALALLPLPVVIWHGLRDAGDLWIGSAWQAGAIACATMAHLVRDRHMRLIAISVLAAAVVPLMTRGFVQITSEHQSTVEFFQQNKQQILRDRGWAPGSSAAQIYERRLLQPQPTAWFASPNVFASLMIFAAVLTCGWIVAGVVQRMQGGWNVALGLLFAAAAIAIYLTGSKGAVIAALLGFLLLLAFWRIGFLRRRAGAVALAVVALAMLGIVLRGVVLPEGFLNELSLLFRWHYLAAAGPMFADHPWLGVGPAGFQEVYTLYRHPRNPEEVASAHSVFVDWLTTMGILGSAWVVLLTHLVWQGAASFRSHAPDAAAKGHAASLSSPGPVLLIVLTVVIGGMLPAIWLEWPAIDGAALSSRILGIGGFMLATLLLWHVAAGSQRLAISIGLLSAAAALLVHAQIEMTFTQPGSVIWCMCAMGLLGAEAKPATANERSRLHQIGSGSLLIALPIPALWLLMFGWFPAWQQQREQMQAAALLATHAESPLAPSDLADRRAEAAMRLISAYDLWPINVHPLHAATDQLQLAAAGVGDDVAVPLLQRAREIIHRAIQNHDDPSSIARAIGIHVGLEMRTGDSQHWAIAIDLSHQLTQRDPKNPHIWRRYGDVLWSAGQRRRAAQAYQRALERNQDFMLDPLKQLTESERQHINERIASTTAASQG